MANLQIIKELAREKNISLEQLAKDLGITPQALSKLMRENSTKVSTLERIAQILKVSVTVFFDKEPDEAIVIADNQSLAISGNNNIVPNENEQLISLLMKQSEQIDRLIAKKDEQTDRFLSIIESLNNSLKK